MSSDYHQRKQNGKQTTSNDTRLGQPRDEGQGQSEAGVVRPVEFRPIEPFIKRVTHTVPVQQEAEKEQVANTSEQNKSIRCQILTPPPPMCIKRLCSFFWSCVNILAVFVCPTNVDSNFNYQRAQTSFS